MENGGDGSVITDVDEKALSNIVINTRGSIGLTDSIMKIFSDPDSRTESVFDRMKRNADLSKTKDEAITEIREKMDDLLMITDEDGTRRKADVKNRDDVKKLAAVRNVLVRSEGCSFPKNPKTGYVRVTHESLPYELKYILQKSGLLPVYPAVLKEEFMDYKNSIDDIIAWFPLVNVPVYTSTLSMLLTGDAAWPVSDSFSILRIYIQIVRYASHVDFTRSRRLTALAWLGNRLESRSLTRMDLELFAANATVIEDSKELANPRDLITKFDNGHLTPPDIYRLREYVHDVKRYESGWSSERIFREDIVEEHQRDKMELTEKLCEKVDAIKAENAKEKYERTLRILYEFTFKFLHCYEVCIMRLFEDASISPCLPEKYRGDLITLVRVPPMDHVNEDLEKLLVQHRRDLLDNFRDKIMLNTESVSQQRGGFVSNSPSPIDESLLVNQIPGMPTPSELNRYVMFLNYFAPDEESLRTTVALAKKHIENQNVPRIESDTFEVNKKPPVQQIKMNTNE